MNDHEKEFLKAQGIPEILTFNAKGQPISETIKTLMKEQGKAIAFNTTPCSNGNHTLRTRAGHCVQCDTARISFILRNMSFGTIYIAGSVKGQLIKVGSTERKIDRKASLNKSKYGGFNDWEILYSAQCINVGEVEDKIKNALKKHGISNQYNHDNHVQLTSELYKCGYSKAYETVLQIKERDKIELSSETKNNMLIPKYGFPNLVIKAHS